ncbi:MAG: hypothetical protein Q4A43_02155 [Coriobacteriia bacterium]|nr:hypothetical protein [Coriobacteriia bacterium]
MNTTEAQLSLAKRLLTAFFALALVIGLMPISAWAEGDEAQSDASQEQQSDQGEGTSTEGADSSASGDAAANKGSSDAANSNTSDDATAEKGSSDGDDSSAGESAEEGVAAVSLTDTANPSSEEGDSEESGEEGSSEESSEDGIAAASLNDEDSVYFKYWSQMTKGNVYDEIDSMFSLKWSTVHVYDGGNEFTTLSFFNKGDNFPAIDENHRGRYNFTIKWSGGWTDYTKTLILQENVAVSTPDPYVTYDGNDHKWEPVVTGMQTTQSPDGEKLVEGADYRVSYSRDGKDTDDFKSAGQIKVTVYGIGKYSSYVKETRTYTIQPLDTLSVSGTDYEGCYDGESHGDAAVASQTEGTTIEYSTDGDNWSTTVPTVKDVTEDVVTVYVRATNPNFKKKAEASYTLKVTPAKVTAYVEGSSDIVDYDGQYHQISKFKVTKIHGVKEGLYEEKNVVLKDGKTAFVEANQAGTWHMGLTADSFANADSNFDVTFKVADGVLTIKPAEVTVSIKGNTDTQTYNGGEQAISGFEVTGIEGDQASLYSADKVALAEGAIAEAKGTNAGTYEMGLTKESFVSNDSNFAPSFEVTDGSLTIEKRALELNDSASLVYNGKEQAFNIDASKVTGLVDGDRLNLFNAQIRGTEPGTYNEVSEYTWDVINDELNVTKNYTLNVTGELTITEADSSADTDADSKDSSDNESDSSSDTSSDSATPQTGDFAQFAMGAAFVAALAAFGAFFASRRFRGARR